MTSSDQLERTLSKTQIPF